MKYNHKAGILLLSTILIFSLSTCKKDKEPDGFTADFDFSFNHGGMAPDSAMFSAKFPGADSYNWDISGITGSGSNFMVPFVASGDFEATLTIQSGSFTDTKSTPVIVNNFPPGGTAMTIIQNDGEVGTVVIDADSPRWYPIDTIDTGGIGGMDYDDQNKTLYYTSSIKRSFPNGVAVETIYDDSELNPWEDGIVDLAIDDEDQIVYFVINDSYGASTFSTLPLSSMTRTDIGFFTGSPVQFIALDKSKNRYYFTAEFSTAIHFGELSGEMGAVNSNDAQNYALTFDNTNRVLYYVNDGDFDQDFDIVRVFPEMDFIEEVVVENASASPILGLDIDEKNQHLYWTDSDQEVIYRLALNETGAEPEIVFTDVENPRALAIGNFEE